MALTLNKPIKVDITLNKERNPKSEERKIMTDFIFNEPQPSNKSIISVMLVLIPDHW